MRYSKEETMLSERDTLRDLLQTEEGVLRLYHAALLKAESRALRGRLCSLFMAALEDRAAVLERIGAAKTWEEALSDARKAQKQLKGLSEEGDK